MKRLKEIAKFVCGAEAFHAFIHTYFGLSGTTLHLFGWFAETPTVHMWGAIVNAVISLILGIYAWRASPMQTTLRGRGECPMPEIPHNRWPESTLALLRDPYQFISKRCRRYRSDLFQTRLMFRKTICMTGADAAALFYDEDRFTRAGVAPGWLKKTLFGKGGVQGLDSEAHRHRKQMFMSLMARERIERLAAR